MSILAAGFALMLVIEGILPFISPKVWRSVMRQAVELNDGQLRFFGLASMVAGLLILFLVT